MGVDFSYRLQAALSNSELPVEVKNNVLRNSQDFIRELHVIINGDKYLRILVDKERSLGRDYIPADLVLLRGGLFVLNRENLQLRSAAAQSLEDMALAARLQGLTLVVSSAYRSYNRQTEIYSQNVNQMGRQAADRVSARPGHSQHQLGLAVDFGSITNAFAQTPEGRWLYANASRFGWSLSYPRGYEHITGYSWESWHYRYVGGELAAFINKYFNGIQQYALRFIHEWEKLETD
jgi:D-alanyl-D-alanine carboxypeptidase